MNLLKAILCSAALLMAPALFGAQINHGPAVAAAAGQAFTDTLSRADSSPMSTTASGGGTWTNHPGAMSNMQILSAGAQGTGVHSGALATKDNTGATWTTNDYTVKATGANSGTSQQWALLFRMQTGANANGYAAYLDDTTHISIYRIADTGTLAFTLVGSTYAITALNGTTDEVEVKAAGTVFTLFINGVQQTSGGSTRTDATYGSGVPGLYDGNASGAAGKVTGFKVTSP